MNQEIPDVQAGFRKGSGIRDQIANMRWIIGKAKEFQKNSLGAPWVDSRESSLLRRLERGREIGR